MSAAPLPATLLALLCFPAGLAAGGAEPARLPGGLWGGDHIALVVGEEGAAVEYDCATGAIDEPLLLDAEGRFEARGRHSPERGGPEREGEEAPRLPALYRGLLQGETLTLRVELAESGESLGEFTLQRGREARLRKCL